MSSTPLFGFFLEQPNYHPFSRVDFVDPIDRGICHCGMNERKYVALIKPYARRGWYYYISVGYKIIRKQHIFAFAFALLFVGFCTPFSSYRDIKSKILPSHVTLLFSR